MVIHQDRELIFISRIVEDNLGHDAVVVVQKLLRSPGSSLQQLVTALPSLTKNRTKSSLLSLVHHSFVGTRAHKGDTVYTVNKHSICNSSSTRHAKYSLLLRDEYGPESEIVLDGFAVHGRLSRKQVLDLCMASSKGSEEDMDDDGRIDSFSNVLNRMISDGYLCLVSNVDGSGKRGLEETAAEDVQSVKKRKTSKGTISSSVGDESADADEFLTINHSRFLVTLRNQFIVHYVESKFEGNHALIVQEMLRPKQGHFDDLSYRNEFSDFGLSSLLKKQSSLSPSLSRSCIEELEASAIPVVKYKHSQDLGDTCFVDIDGLLKEARISRVQSILQKKFGDLHARIFRLLCEKKHLQMKQISEFALVSEKKCREILISLSKENFINVQEVPKTADREPRNTLYLWRVDLDNVVDGLLGTFYVAYNNLRERQCSEDEKNKLLLQKVSRYPDMPKEHFSDKERTQFSQYDGHAVALEAASQRLDDSIMVFGDFSLFSK